MRTAAQIVNLACQIAKCPGYTYQAGELLNTILSDLCQTYDFAVARGTTFFDFNQQAAYPANPNVQMGSAYTLPADYLRAQDEYSVFWSLNGVPYPLISCDLDQFDMMVQQAGIQSYPYMYATDMSQSPPIMYVYPPPSGDYPVTVRYLREMPNIVTPESSDSVPWFPNQSYLITRLAGELMRITDDSRMSQFLGDGDEGAQGILTRYLKMKDDKNSRSQNVSLDRRRFGRNFTNLPNTKNIGW